jgi:hypothetical protein
MNETNKLKDIVIPKDKKDELDEYARNYRKKHSRTFTPEEQKIIIGYYGRVPVKKLHRILHCGNELLKEEHKKLMKELTKKQIQDIIDSIKPRIN